MTIPRVVNRKTLSVALPIRLMAFWYSPSTPMLSFRVSSKAYNMVAWMAARRFRAAASGTQ